MNLTPFLGGPFHRRATTAFADPRPGPAPDSCLLECPAPPIPDTSRPLRDRAPGPCAPPDRSRASPHTASCRPADEPAAGGFRRCATAEATGRSLFFCRLGEVGRLRRLSQQAGDHLVGHLRKGAMDGLFQI